MVNFIIKKYKYDNFHDFKSYLRFNDMVNHILESV